MLKNKYKYYSCAFTILLCCSSSLSAFTQWSKDFGNGGTTMVYPWVFDIDNDGINEVYNIYEPSTFYNGSDGSIKWQLTTTKPSSDWVGPSGMAQEAAALNRNILPDIDGDGHGELVVYFTSAPAGGNTIGQIQVYDSVTKGLKWTSSNITDFTMASVGKTDSSNYRQIIYATSKYNAGKYDDRTMTTGQPLAVTYYIKGYAKDSGGTGISGITVSLSGIASGTYTTTSSGYYEFLSLASGNYTVTPSNAGYSFNPTNKSYSPLSSNQDNQDFTGTTAAVTYYIKGYAKDSGGTGISGITVSLSGIASGTYTTTSSGYYEFLSLASGNYTITPSKTNYTFTPAGKSYSPLNSNQNNQDFTGIPLTYQSTVNVGPTISTSSTIGLSSGGNVTLQIDTGTFATASSITISTGAVPISDRPAIKTTNIGIEITAGGLQPQKDIIITLYYNDADIVGLDETKLAVGRYDFTQSRWLTVPTTVYPAQNKVICLINHLSTFALLQVVPLPKPTISLSGSSLSFSAQEGGSNPSNQTFRITNSGDSGSALNWAASDDMNWLTLSSTFGAISSGSYSDITVSVNIAGLTAGTYTGTITVTDANASNNPQTISVTLTISKQPQSSVSVTSLDFGSLKIGQSKALTFTITDTNSSGSLSGTISANQSWTTIDKTTFSGNSTVITVTANTSGLKKSQYSGTISITSNGGNASVTVSVTATCVLTKPNPYNPRVGTLRFFGSGIMPNNTKIRIYTVSGKLVKTLNETVGNEVEWSGRNEDGEEVVNGIYLYVSESPTEKSHGKFTVVKK